MRCLVSGSTHDLGGAALANVTVSKSSILKTLGIIRIHAQGEDRLIIADLEQIAGRTYPARRRTQNLVGGASPIQATNFALGNVTLEPRGGQVPWHNQDQEEIYFIVEGTGEMYMREERRAVKTGQ